MALGLPDTGEEVSVRRVVGRAGRGRVHVNGALASVGTLGQLFQGLLDIAGQHAHVALFQPAFQRSLLDKLAKVALAREAYRTAYGALLAVDTELAALGESAQGEARLDFVRFQLEEVQRLSPQRGRGRGAGRGAPAGFPPWSGCGRPSRRRTCTSPRRAGHWPPRGAPARLVDEAARHDGQLEQAASALKAAAAELEEASSSLRHYLAGLEADPERLAQVEERLDALKRLARKHGTDVPGLPGRLVALKAEAEALAGRTETLEALRARRSLLEASAWEAARALTDGARARRGRAFAQRPHGAGGAGPQRGPLPGGGGGLGRARARGSG